MGVAFLNTKPSQEAQNVIYEVSSGKGVRAISQELVELNVLTSSELFSLFVRITGNSKHIRVGEYALTTSMYPRDVLNVILSGKSIERPITVQEGLNKYEIADLFERSNLGSRAEFLNLVDDSRWASELLGESIPSLEGYLYPETYHITKYEGARGLIKQMVHTFLKNFETVPNSPRMSRHEIVTLASIIEKETGAPEERRIISSVFHNRLQKNMRLQTDPTVLYGLMEETKVPQINIRKEDLRHPTRYNTYTFSGLPFGPIANPGISALQAAVLPDSTPYLYFVSRNDGTHVFSESYESHSKAVDHFQKRSSSRKGKSWRDRLKK